MPAADSSDEDWPRVINVNLNSVFYCCRGFGKMMLEQGKGEHRQHGVNVWHHRQHAAAAIRLQRVESGRHSAHEIARGEWAKRGLRVNSISPGYVATEITNLRTSITEWHQKWLELAPMGRLGEVSEGPAPRLISPRMPAAIHRQQPGHGRRLYELGRDDWEQGHSFLPLEADS